MQVDYESALERPCTMLALTLETAVRKGMNRDKAMNIMARHITAKLDEYESMPELQFAAHVVAEMMWAKMYSAPGGDDNEM